MSFPVLPTIDVYNEDESINKLVCGNIIDWKTWHGSDKRQKPIWAEEGDRYFLYQIGRGIVSAGLIGEANFVKSQSRNIKCGSVHIELIPDKVGEPIIPTQQVEEVVANTAKPYEKTEIVIANKSDVAKLETLWFKAVIENNPRYLEFDENFWLMSNLHEQTLYAIHKELLSGSKRGSVCGNDLNGNNLLVFRPIVNLPAYKSITSYKDLLLQYTILCKECAAIEMELH